MRRLFIGFLVFPLLVLLGSTSLAAPATCSITIIHGLPRLAYDVYVNGQLTLDGFKPKSATEPLQLPAGPYDVAVRNVGSPSDSKPVVEATIKLKPGINYTAVAHLTSTGGNTLSLVENDVSQVRAGEGRMVVRDLAEAPSVDVMLNGAAVFRSLTNPEQSEKLLPAQRYSLDVVSSAGANSLFGPTPVNLAEGSGKILYLIGSADDQSLDVMAQDLPDLGSGPAGVSAGSGGLAAPPGFPMWAVVAMAVAAVVGAAAAVALRRPTPSAP